MGNWTGVTERWEGRGRYRQVCVVVVVDLGDRCVVRLVYCGCIMVCG